MRRRRQTRKKTNPLLSGLKWFMSIIGQNWPRILVVIFLFGATLFLLLNITSFIFASPLFNIKEIEVIDRYPDKIEYPIGRIDENLNIFRIDLKGIARKLERNYPDVQRAIVDRVLPDKLVIEILRRRPVARIAVSVRPGIPPEQFIVNEDCHVLGKIKGEDKHLPLIQGVGVGKGDVEIGRCCDSAKLRYALSFLKELRQNGFLDIYRINTLSIDDRNISFYVDDRLEVRIANRDWRQKLENLVGILKDLDMDSSQEYYLDLRFRDLVFGKK